MGLLRDIWSTHKVFMFGAFNCTEYKLKTFREEVMEAEWQILGKRICSQRIDTLFGDKCTLYPSWLIHDDIFEVMKYQFAVSQWVNQLVQRKHIETELNVICCVIPKSSAVSLYDPEIKHESSFGGIQEYLKSNKMVKNIRAKEYEKMDSLDVLVLVDRIREMITFDTVNEPTTTVLLFDRSNALYNGNKCNESLIVFECDSMDSVPELMKNHFLSLRFNMCRHCRADGGGVESATLDNYVVRSWLHYGNGEHIRFWPEQLVWFIPRLFVKNKKLSGYQTAERLYSNDYKHGFCVNLSYPVFDRFYKILTSWNHQSVNYRRTRWRRTRGIRFGLRDYVEDRMSGQSILKLTAFWNQNGYSSDDILDDIDSMQIDEESNIAAVLEGDDGALEELRNLAKEYGKKSDAQCEAAHPLEIWKCRHVKEMIENLRKFEVENFEVNAANICDFDESAVIRGLDHLVVVHKLFSMENKQRIQHYFKEEICCKLKAECPALQQHCSRRREIDGETGKGQNEEEMDEVDSILEVVVGALSSAHCYLLHSEETLYRLSGQSHKFEVNPFGTAVVDDVKEKDDAKKENVPSSALSIDFGVHILKWLPFGVKPMFQSFEEEMIKNPASTLSPQLLDQFRVECIAKLDGKQWTKDNLDELMCLKVYSDCTDFQNKFRRAYWERSSMETKRAFYHWASKMYQTFLYHAQPIPQSENGGSGPKTLYHGLNKLFQVDNTAPTYQGPFSTTDSKDVAHGFADEQGLIFSVKASYSNPIRFILGIDMMRISCFKHERETLLYSQTLPIASTETFENDDNLVVDHLMYSLHATEQVITDKYGFFKRIGVHFNPIWIPLIISHFLYQQLAVHKKQKVLSADIGFGEWAQFLVNRDEIECSIVASEIRFINIPTDWWKVSQLLSLCVFAVSVDGVSNDRKYHFKDVSEFRIPITFTSLTYPHSVVSLLVGPMDGSVGVVVPFKEIQYHPRRYRLNQKEPQRIKNVMKAPDGDDGGIQIISASDIIITSDGGINADGTAEMQSGGAIHLQSRNNIVNHGVLSCNGIEPLFNGGIVYIAANGAITNDGQIECALNGRIVIQCREFVNDGSMSSCSDIWILTSTLQEGDAMMVDHLMHSLHAIEKEAVVNKDAFFRRIGVFFKAEWIPLIVNHPIYSRLTEYKKMTVLSEELGFGEWSQFTQFKDNIHCDFTRSEIIFKETPASNQIVVNHNKSRYLTFCAFAVSVDGVLDDRSYRFPNVSNIHIPIDLPPMLLQRYPHPVTTLWIGPSDGSIKRMVPFKDFQLHPERYELNQEEPLRIENVLEVSPFDAKHGKRGSIHIECTSDIMIGSNGGIDADGSGLKELELNEYIVYDQYFKQKNNGQRDRFMLRFGSVSHSENESDGNPNDGAGGGIIALQSRGSITSGGILSSRGIGDIHFEGGSICLCAHNVIINRGQIDCGQNGRIMIQCREFVNEGSISSETEIMISNESEKREIGMVMMPWNGCDLKETPLSVYKHRGHIWNDDSHHPRNLLDGKGAVSSYWSKKPAEDDWMIFKIESGSIVIPKRIMIRNTDWKDAIKSIEVSLGSDGDNGEFDVLSAIPLIAKNSREDQYFELENVMMNAATIWMKDYKFVKLRVIENWGGKQNSFCSFSVLGKECESDE